MKLFKNAFIGIILSLFVGCTSLCVQSVRAGRDLAASAVVEGAKVVNEKLEGPPILNLAGPALGELLNWGFRELEKKCPKGEEKGD